MGVEENSEGTFGNTPLDWLLRGIIVLILILVVVAVRSTRSERGRQWWERDGLPLLGALFGLGFAALLVVQMIWGLPGNDEQPRRGPGVVDIDGVMEVVDPVQDEVDIYYENLRDSEREPPVTRDLDCADFLTQYEAQRYLNLNPYDSDLLDGDFDGQACEALP